MALLTIDHMSEVLGLQMSCNVVLPQTPGGPPEDGYPTLWLLHGKSDDHTIWLRRTSIERYAEPLGLAVVMPAAHVSFYANLPTGERYWDYISRELPELLEGWLPLAKTRERRFAAGLSMGGWGAMKLALNQPERFAAAASLSGAIWLSSSRWENSEDAERFFGKSGNDEYAHSEDRLLELATKHIMAGTALPRLFACCGTEDFLIEDNRFAIAEFRKAGVSIDYEEGPGEHT